MEEVEDINDGDKYSELSETSQISQQVYCEKCELPSWFEYPGL